MDNPPDLQLTAAKQSTVLPICNIWDDSAESSVSSELLQLAVDAERLDSDSCANWTSISSELVVHPESQTQSTKRVNGWLVFWKAKESQSIIQPGETLGERRKRILKQAQEEWQASSLRYECMSVCLSVCLCLGRQAGRYGCLYTLCTHSYAYMCSCGSVCV